MVEAFAEPLHLTVQLLFTGMGERGMADVVNQGQGFGEIFIEGQHIGHGARDLCDLNGVGQTIAEVIAPSPGVKTCVLASSLADEKRENAPRGPDRVERRCGRGGRARDRPGLDFAPPETAGAPA